MDRGKLNFVIDSLMFLTLMAIAGLGFLMKFTLPPGREVQAVYGRNVYLTWLGWDRHDWGSVHLYLAFTLLSLLAIHLILHWSLIVGLLARLIPNPKTRHRVALVFLLVGLLLLYFPFLVTPEEGRGGGRGLGRGGGPRSQAGAWEQKRAAARAWPARLPGAPAPGEWEPTGSGEALLAPAWPQT
jgi:hypothetical protein